MKEKILDVNTFSFESNSVVDNLKEIHSLFGKKFKIKNNDVILPASLQKNKKTFYVLKSQLPYSGETYPPFEVTFIDFLTKEVSGGGCYINYFNKTKEFSGTQIIESIILFLKILKIERCILNDAASIGCSKDEQGRISLSFLKIMESGYSFYERFGFEPLLDSNSFYNFREYGTLLSSSSARVENEKKSKRIETLLKKEIVKFRKLKTKNLIEKGKAFVEIVSKSLFEGRECITLPSDSLPSKSLLAKIKEYPSYLWMKDFLKFFQILIKNSNGEENEKLCETLISIFKNDCDNYLFMERSVTNIIFPTYAKCGNEEVDFIDFISPSYKIWLYLGSIVFVKYFKN